MHASCRKQRVDAVVLALGEAEAGWNHGKRYDLFVPVWDEKVFLLLYIVLYDEEYYYGDGISIR